MYLIALILSLLLGLAGIVVLFKDDELETGFALIALSLLLGIKADCIDLRDKIDAVNSSVAAISAPADPATAPADPAADAEAEAQK